ncbi:MAG: GNAT family N-acetyltransferase [Candidatus Hydrogenedentota bacterium]|nr:MAG: GNAT family N-acetyltransferase [Candidatus Hydrogenedentota bacterium]
MKQRPTLHTARLVLRPFELADAKDVQRLAGDKAIADTTLNIPHPYEDGMAEAWIFTQQPKFEAGELVNFAIDLRGEGALIGSIGLTIRARFERAELGYWIGKSYWNCGYCTEAARAVVRYGFEMLNLNRIWAAHMTRNPASGKVLQKLGMVHEGVARQHTKKWDVFEDLEFYAMIKSDWQENAQPHARTDS